LLSRFWLTIIAIGLAFSIAGAFALFNQYAGDDELIHAKGTVKYLNFEGGFYGIVSDSGRNYDPVSMPQEFRVDGLRVRFTANFTNYLSFHMWGIVVKLVSIERLP
jgi:hypothetical protein